ncbi:zf-TFIIB domain-containing protein [Cereibacter azotoformans]|uniref:TFIIB-type zinc ribbon-containing protein n=1 Tax=Cereibacter azotoformans TaxID=43057 RepID=UPI000C6CEC04|nr:zf-TFIIB domain-containing protein [Cereibacter azotoformans]
MKCPIDGETLLMTERSGIEIDYCPKCRGVWLDRGELEMIIERAAPVARSQTPRGGFIHRHDDASHRVDGHGAEHGHGDHGTYRHRKKREGFLGELFDF